jgi:hypothetical protein
MKPKRFLWVVASLSLSGCTGDAGEQSFTLVADLADLMSTVVDPAADTYWDAVGWIVDSTGTTEIRPRTPEEWELVRNAAYQVAESGNLMMMEGRGVDEAAYTAFAQAMITTGQRAIEAAQDPMGVFDTGADLYAVCSGCHETYAREVLRPNARLEGD